jgi:hypothetical protein
MNIFVLDETPTIAASYHCDKHVLKMILESGQMLCTAHWLGWLNYLKKDIKDFKTQKAAKDFLYQEVPSVFQPEWKMTHINHPCSVWTRESLENYDWHSNLGLALCKEYEKRYEKIHKSYTVHKWLSKNHPPEVISKGQTPFEICMKNEYKISSDPVDCYREYYLRDKSRFAKWKIGNKPAWWSL